MFKFQKWYQELLLLAILLGCLYLFFSLIPITKNINQELNGIRYGSDSSEKVTVIIEGQYTNYLINGLKQDYFQGSLTLSYSPEMECVGTYYFNQENGVSSTGLYSVTSYDNIGTLYQRKNLSQGVIISADNSDLPFICFPCDTIEEAEKLTEAILPSDVLEIILNP